MKKTLKKLTACAVALGVAISAAAGAAFAWFSNGVAAKGFAASVARVGVKIEIPLDADTTEQTLALSSGESAEKRLEIQKGSGKITFKKIYGTEKFKITAKVQGEDYVTARKNQSSFALMADGDVLFWWSFPETEEVAEASWEVANFSEITYSTWLDATGVLPVTFTFTAVEG